MVKELSNSNEQLRNYIAELKHQVEWFIANTEKERSEHEKATQDMQHNAEERAMAMETEHARALKEANAKLRSNLQQSHEYESERLVRHYEKEARDREREFRKCIDECTAELKRNQELMEIKEASYQTKLEEMAKQIDAIKADSTKKIPPQPSARKSLGTLKKEAFEILPGTVNTNRGSTAPATSFSVNWDENTLPPSNKHVHFGQCTSTSQHISPIDLHDESEDIISGSSLNSAKPIPAKRSHRSIDCTYPEEVATTAITHVIANEFKKLKEPKLAKLKGGYLSKASLFFQGWAKDVRAIVEDRQLTDSEAIQLIKEHTEASARKQVDSFLDLTEHPTFDMLMKELAAVYSPTDDDASLMSEFYSCKQLAKETDDAFAEELQLLARKIINAKSSFRSEANNAMKQQFTNGLKDTYHQILARNILQSKPQLTFTEFRTEMSMILRSRAKCPKTVHVNAVDNVEIGKEDEPPKPAKRHKQGGNNHNESDIIARVAAVQAENQ